MLRRKSIKKVSPTPPWDPPVAVSTASSLVYTDFNRRTCIEVERTHDDVSYIPFDAEEGLRVLRMRAREFDQKFKSLLDYPVERAAKLYIAYATNLGATRDALKHLGAFTHISEGEISMATAKKTAADTKKAVAADKKSKKNPDDKLEAHDAKDSVMATLEKISKNNKKLGVTDAPATKPSKTVKPEPAAKAKPEAKTPRTSAAQMFKDLIMEGKLSDQQIFHKVQDAFGLDDSKSGYVKWYRNNLKKTGQNPPAEKK